MGEEMTDGERPAAAADWDRARQRYETTSEAVTAIAADLGITRQALLARARRDGWTLRSAARPRRSGTRDTIARLKVLLQQRLGELESQIGSLGVEATAASSERDIRAMNTLVRTLEKVLELERKDRAQRSRKRREHRAFDDAERDALAERLEALHREWTGEAAEPLAERPPSEGMQP